MVRRLETWDRGRKETLLTHQGLADGGSGRSREKSDVVSPPPYGNSFPKNTEAGAAQRQKSEELVWGDFIDAPGAPSWGVPATCRVR